MDRASSLSMSFTGTPTTRVPRPASRSPRLSPAAVPAVPMATSTWEGSGSSPAATWSPISSPASTYPSTPTAVDPPAGRMNGGRRPLWRRISQGRVATVLARVWVKWSSAPDALSRSSWRSTCSSTRLVHQGEHGAQPVLGAVQRGGEPPVGAEAAHGHDHPGAAPPRLGDEPFELAHLVAAPPAGAEGTVVLEPHRRAAGGGDARERAHGRRARPRAGCGAACPSARGSAGGAASRAVVASTASV